MLVLIKEPGVFFLLLKQIIINNCTVKALQRMLIRLCDRFLINFLRNPRSLVILLELAILLNYERIPKILNLLNKPLDIRHYFCLCYQIIWSRKTEPYWPIRIASQSLLKYFSGDFTALTKVIGNGFEI